MNKKAFTLLELLVVVLIIGILAAITLPQYKMAVAKSKYSTLKNITKAIADAEELYYVQNGSYTNDPSKLGIDFTGVSMSGASLYFQNGSSCYIWNVSGNSGQKAVACWIYINKKKVYYYNYFLQAERSAGTRLCLVYSVDKTDIPNRVCQNDTGKTAAQAGCSTSDGYCDYKY